MLTERTGGLPSRFIQRSTDVFNTVRDLGTHELLAPLVYGRISRYDLNKQADRDIWEAIVIGTILDTRAEVGDDFLEAAARLRLYHQVSLIENLLNNGWNQVGRRNALPVLISYLVDVQARKSYDQAEKKLEIFKGLVKKLGDNDFTQTLLRGLPKHAQNYKKDLQVLGI